MLPRTSDPAAAGDLSRLSVNDLAGASRREGERFRRGEPSRDAFGIELFRRAVCGRETAAWEALAAQYRGLMLTWLKRHPAAALVHEEDDYWVNHAFARFWQALGPERIHHFTTLASLLAYLRMCTLSVLMDEVRARKATGGAGRESAAGEAQERQHADAEEVGALVVSRLSGQEVWRVIARELPAETDRLVVYLSFARFLSPGEIHRRYPDRFPTAADVYRIKRNVLDRLRRSPAMRSLIA
jgi:hypothetical protein